MANYFNRRPTSSSGGQHSKGNFKNGYGWNGGFSHQDSNQDSYRPFGGPNNSKKSIRQHKYTPKCQIYDELGHIAKHCPRLRFVEPTTNYVATSPATNPKWLIDYGTSHNITSDLANLFIHFEYDDTDEGVIGDGSGLHVSHVGSLVLKSPTHTFHLNDTLCVPNIRKNLISVHHFTSQNNVFVEFHPLFFLVKDKIMGAVLLKGACENDVYTLPDLLVQDSPKMVANVHERTLINGWHKRLGHPSQKIVHHLVKNFYLLIIQKEHSSHLCTSCSITKVHKQPFQTNSLQSHAPLHLIYTNVWGPSNTIGLDGSRYYLILVDYFTKYIWFYPMETKSQLSMIFPQFKHLVENQFQSKIKSIYLDNGGEFVALKFFFLYMA